MKATGRGRVSHRVQVPGSYVPMVRQDWATHVKADFAGLIGTEGASHLKAPPISPTLCYDLVSDPLFGKVMRYHGGPHLNTTETAMGGRVATYSVDLGEGAGHTPGSDWWLAPNGKRYPTHIWLRQYIRFSPNWTNACEYGGQGSGDYKTIFLRYYNSAARHQFKVTNLREWRMEGGNPGLTFTEQGHLPWHNVQSLDQQYGGTGFPGADLYPMVRPSNPATGNCFPANAPCASQGDGQFYEIVIHHKTVGNRGEFSQYLRRVTPTVTPWRINAMYSIASPGQVFIGLSSYQMGVNRNRQYDEVMYHDWGPHEIVDGGRYPNPWNLPGA